MPPTPASATEKTLHWVVAAVVLALVVTGAIMYVPALSQVLGQRFWVRSVHLGAAAATALAPGVIAALRWPDVRSVERELSFWGRADIEWFTRPWNVFRGGDTATAGKRGRFNGGQKLFAALIVGALSALLLTGIPMYWWDHFNEELVARARDLHVVLALALGALLAGHVYLGLLSPYGIAGRRSLRR
jgi:formate dehydrogenase subunit gamma